MSNAFSPDAYRRAVTDYDHTWRATDATLYDLCRRYPGHGDQAGVHAKLWIIGRTYATGIERKIPTKGTQGSSMSQLARHMLDHPAEVEAIFSPLAQLAEPLRADMLPTIIEQHGRFVRFLQPLTRKRQPPRAFCSKYMHFHCPAVPIIDSFAHRAITMIQRWQDDFQLFPFDTDVDNEYGWYVLSFWHLYQQAFAAGLHVPVPSLLFRRHGFRARKFMVISDRSVETIACTLVRWRCPVCQRTFTEYPFFATPHKRYLRPQMMTRALQYVEDDAISYRKGVLQSFLPIFHPEAPAPPFGTEPDFATQQGPPVMAHSSLYHWVSTLGVCCDNTREAQGPPFVPAQWKFTTPLRRDILIACRGRCRQAPAPFA